jgi:hypothetical protein
VSKKVNLFRYINKKNGHTQKDDGVKKHTMPFVYFKMWHHKNISGKYFKQSHILQAGPFLLANIHRCDYI